MTTWTEVLPEHQANVGFVEGANNQNPWGPEQGVSNASYCDSAACMVPYHHGVRWPAESQFGEKGCAYCPYDVNVANARGWFQYDHTSQGHPCDLLPGDKVYFSWGSNGVADHVETVIAVYADGTFDTIGYNTGHPEGCHLIRRDRKYLLGRWRMQGTMYTTAPAPQPQPPTPQPPKKETHYMLPWLVQIPGEDAWYWTDWTKGTAHVVNPTAARVILDQYKVRNMPVVCNATYDGPFVLGTPPYSDTDAAAIVAQLRSMV